MNNRPKTDVQEIVEHSREINRERGQELSLAEIVSAPLHGQGVIDLAFLQSCYDMYNIHFTSHRKILGWPIIFAKRLLRRLLTPILERQLAYNTANTHVVSALWEHGKVINQQQEATCQTLRTEMAGQKEAVLQTLRMEMAGQQEATCQTLQKLRTEMAEQIEKVGQQRASAFQAFRETVVGQVERLGQQQDTAIQALRDMVVGQVEQLGEQLRHQLAERDARLVQQDTPIQALHDMLVGQVEQLGEQLHHQLAERDARFVQQDTAIQALRDMVVGQVERLGEQLHHQLAERNARLVQQYTAIQALRDMVVGQVERLGEQLHHQLAERDARLVQQDTAIQALRDMVVGQVERLGEQLHHQLAERDARLVQQDTAIQALRDMVVGQVERLGEQLHHQLAERDARLVQQDTAIQALRDMVVGQVEQLGEQLHHQLAERDARLVQQKTQLILQERRITILLEEARKRLPEPFSPEQLQVMTAEEKRPLEALYVSFEDQFRGTREDIKERCRAYLPLMKEAGLGTDAMPILDLGCGRGEWLELLRETGLQARGLDSNPILVEECRKRELEVVEGDLIAYLRSLPDASVGGVTGFHILEHLPFEILINALDETVRVLQPGGLAIFETPNPQNVLVGSCNFYIDPTHLRPLHSQMMQFLAEARGLCHVKILYLHPSEISPLRESTEVAERFNEYFYGPMDYAIVGRRV